MPYRPRELAVRAREAAALLLSALDREQMVSHFVDDYTAVHRRPGRGEQPAHYTEQVETIRREAIFAMVLRVESSLPPRLKVHTRGRAEKPRRKAKKAKFAGSPAKKTAPVSETSTPTVNLFREEFFVALGRALNWRDDDLREFWRDLDLYQRLSARLPGQRTRPGAVAAASGPFADRVALLLDPSLLEQARHFAARFQLELEATADRILEKVFSRRREN
jgi:hypothetical protein